MRENSGMEPAFRPNFPDFQEQAREPSVTWAACTQVVNRGMSNPSPSSPQSLSEIAPVEPRIPPRAVHLCLDMQNLLGPDGPWQAEWAERVLPALVSLAEHAPARTIFTRFMPPAEPGDVPGAWRDFYRKWAGLTLNRIEPAMLELMAPLNLFVPPARVIEKQRYSAFSTPETEAALRALGADAVIVSGAESDMCVLATVLAAVDLGYPVIVAEDAVCSSADPTHDAVQELYHARFSQQVQTLTTAAIKELWRPAEA
jgi:nicotinamidase-related amidase